jgi:hypothetical protein
MGVKRKVHRLRVQVARICVPRRAGRGSIRSLCTSGEHTRMQAPLSAGAIKKRCRPISFRRRNDQCILRAFPTCTRANQAHRTRGFTASIRHLKVFERVAHLQSVRRASEECHLSQPAVTQAVAKLEKQLGETLLDRPRPESWLPRRQPNSRAS